MAADHNALVAAESFNGRLRDEFLNETTFTSLAQARVLLEQWRSDHKLRPPALAARLSDADDYADLIIRQ